jgi:hypothetical protein
MSRPAEEILASIIENFLRCEKSHKDLKDLEEKAIFCLLNYCPPSELNAPLAEEERARPTKR